MLEQKHHRECKVTAAANGLLLTHATKVQDSPVRTPTQLRVQTRRILFTTIGAVVHLTLRFLHTRAILFVLRRTPRRQTPLPVHAWTSHSSSHLFQKRHHANSSPGFSAVAQRPQRLRPRESAADTTRVPSPLRPFSPGRSSRAKQVARATVCLHNKRFSNHPHGSARDEASASWMQSTSGQHSATVVPIPRGGSYEKKRDTIRNILHPTHHIVTTFLLLSQDNTIRPLHCNPTIYWPWPPRRATLAQHCASTSRIKTAATFFMRRTTHGDITCHSAPSSEYLYVFHMIGTLPQPSQASFFILLQARSFPQASDPQGQRFELRSPTIRSPTTGVYHHLYCSPRLHLPTQRLLQTRLHAPCSCRYKHTRVPLPDHAGHNQVDAPLRFETNTGLPYSNLDAVTQLFLGS
ncbi:hypothetical protein BBAD15_g12450 [Beauveria bassiana D1-5]|uniref:Uncharacterized protein n=1 Tax=Beauveria bassiana D1-5 TaxID=1245745 RepID=A0A0A2V8B1_BEABA|nr:hypothetical protein BBAD15_g12450 [Beauveria bassiana D1-5]